MRDKYIAYEIESILLKIPGASYNLIWTCILSRMSRFFGIL
jgi:hypothetical protein